jgi:hypothetical protein
MSAWVVSDEHISYLVHAAMHAPYGIRFGYVKVNHETATAVGRDLLQENINSVYHRYDEDTEAGDMFRATSDHESVMLYVCPRIPSKRFDVVTALKAVDCYEYQSCEHPGWQTSQSRAFCEELRSSLIGQLPGYDAAPWGIESDTSIAA